MGVERRSHSTVASGCGHGSGQQGQGDASLHRTTEGPPVGGALVTCPYTPVPCLSVSRSFPSTGAVASRRGHGSRQQRRGDASLHRLTQGPPLGGAAAAGALQEERTSLAGRCELAQG
ncbi:unnamed protein product, partial [Closterium sp. NIES-53]